MFHKTSSRKGRTSTLLIAVVFLAAQDLEAASNVPTGGAFVAGTGNIAASGNILTINQNSLKGIVDWNTFSISQGATVNFKNGSGVTLNRVTGRTPTTILGQLLATGSIYVLNPEGVLIGHGATVNTGGDFLASTLQLPNSFFLNNHLQFGGDSSATVVNLGDIASTGGNIYLIARTVENSGSISARNGTAGLAAGSQVLIADSSTGQKISIQAPGGDATNSGFINAAQAELKSNGGNIYALAGNNGGQINATGTAIEDGHIWLIAANGSANVSGRITAANADGTGGGIETSGAQVNTNGAQIITGKGGNWLLDPDDLLINSALAGTIEGSLNGGTNVTEQTGSGNSGVGDITVASSIAWTTGANLTLSAFRNIGVNSGVVISNTGSGNLTLRADNTSIGIGTINFADNTAKTDFSGSTGSVALLYNPSSYAAPTVYSSNFGAVNGAWSAPANGSVSSQYTAYMLVNQPSDLQNINSNLTGTGVYALGKDLDLSAISNFVPIGAPSSFFGIFDGMGHTLNNLTMTTNLNAGLFSSVAGQVRNVNLTNVSITATSGNSVAGALAANVSGIISNSTASGIIHADPFSNNVGGLVGSLELVGGTVQYSQSSVTIDAGSNGNSVSAGGLVGYAFPTTVIQNSSASGSVTGGPTAYVGGLVGNNNGGAITNSHATGAVSGGPDSIVGGLIGYSSGPVSHSWASSTVTADPTAEYVGGLIGQSDVGGTISNSYATGNVAGDEYVGGLTGINADAITNSYATGSVTSMADSYIPTRAGGLSGSSSAPITGSWASGAISAANAYSYIGGLVGVTSAGGTIANSYATGAVTATNDTNNQVGGLVGASGDAISQSYATGAVSGGGNALVGGLVGQSGSPISNSYAIGATTGGDNSKAGGLTGENNDTISLSYATGAVNSGSESVAGGLSGLSNAAISTSYALGPVTSLAFSSAGGLVGETGAAISDTYARGAVTISQNGEEGAGGLVGFLDSGGTITRSYASGLVICPFFAGGLAAYNAGASNITYSYYDNTVNSSLMGVGSGDGSGVSGETTAMLQGGVMPAGYNPGNPYNVWVAPAGVYPYFGWQGPLVTVSGKAYDGSSVIPSAGVGVMSSGLMLGNLTTNSAGFYTISEPQNMVASGVLSYLTSNGTANTFSDGGGSNNFTGMDLHTGALIISNSSSTMLSGLNAALSNALLGNTGPNFLFSVPNGQLSLSTGTNLSIASSASSFTVDQPLTGTGAVLINSTGNLSIAAGSPITAAAGANIMLAAGGVFANNDGGSALGVSGGGNWLVYSQTPAGNNPGGLTPNFIQYNAVYGESALAASGNGLLYTVAPTITVSIDGAVNKVYDGTTNVSSTGASLTGTGAIQGDTISLTPGSAVYASANAGTGIGVTPSGVGLTAANGSIPVYGYQINLATADIGTITPATLTYVANSASQSAGSTNNAFSGMVTGFVDGQTLASATAGSAVFTSATSASTPAGSYSIHGSGLTADNGNYIFTQAASNSTALTITVTSTPPPTAPTPTPAPMPTPTPVPAPVSATTITIDISSLTELSGQPPAFAATYSGAALSGLNIAALLAGLNYQITPALNGPGTYKITATGMVPVGYALSIVPGLFTVLDDSPALLPTQGRLFIPETPNLLSPGETGSESDLLAPANSLGMFQINTISTGNTGNAFGSSFAGFDAQQTPLSQYSFFGATNDKPNTFTAGAKP